MLKEHDITTEEWRAYDFNGRVFKIYSPQKLFYREGGTTHRILGVHGVVFCVPAPGFHGCVLSWKNKDPDNPCEF